MPNLSISKKILACALLSFPILAIIGFALHFPFLHDFFHFRWERPPYDAGRLFDALAAGRGHGFRLAHYVVYLSIPFLLVAVLVLAAYLLRVNQAMAMTGACLGIIGCLAMAGVLSTWLSYAAIGHVQPESYAGARAALIKLTEMEGFLRWNTDCSYLAFIGLIILAGGLLLKTQFPTANMICLIIGAILFLLFMDMDNWMLIGTILLGIGSWPVAKRLWRKS